MAAIQSWDNCSICQHILDGNPLRGTHDGLVALSKRCYHVFHKTCIEGWLEEGKRSCPNCNLQNFSVHEVMLNPEHTQQYQKWLADPESYTYEQAFIDEYGHSHEEERLPPEHILRPRVLRGLDRRDELTEQEISSFYREINAVIDKLGPDSTQEQIDKARREIVCAERLIIDSIAERQARNRAQLAENGANLQHQQLLTQYYRKVDGLERKVDEKAKELDKLSFNPEKNRLERELINVSRRLTDFNEEFRLNGRTNERSIAESRELLELVDAQLDAFVAEQPEHIKAILTAEPPQAEENNEPWWQNTTAKIAMLFAFIVGAITFRNYFWKGRNVKPQDEL